MNAMNLNFHDYLYYSRTFFFNKIQFNLVEQENRLQRIYGLLNAETKSKFICLQYTKQRFFFLQKKRFLWKWMCGGLNKKRKEGFLTAFATVIMKSSLRQ